MLARGVSGRAAYGGDVPATPGSMITTGTVSLGRFDGIDVTAGDGDAHQVRIKTTGSSDVHVVINTLAPGEHSGWHTHPGPALIVVTGGEMAFYNSSGRTPEKPRGSSGVLPFSGCSSSSRQPLHPYR